MGLSGTIQLAGCFNTFGALAIAAEELWVKGSSQPQGDSECVWSRFCVGIFVLYFT